MNAEKRRSSGGPSTMKDVAREAGVSTATIARVIHNSGYVSGETRRLVESAILATGYQLNAVAQGLRTRRTFVLGHLLHAISPNPFFANIALGVEEEATSYGCGVLTANTQEDLQLERLAVETLIRRRVDAILFTTVRDEATIRMAIDARIPVVQVERMRLLDMPAVTVDNKRGAFDAVEHLIGLGHRRIAYIGEPPDRPKRYVGDGSLRMVERERLSGYRDALQRNGLAIDDSIVDLGGTYLDLDYARGATRRLLRLLPRPTAIFAACDLIAAGVLQELYANRFRVPDDMSVVGFDDTLAARLTPALTTVSQPMVDIGRLAASMAIAALREPTSGSSGRMAPRQERLTAELVIRDSTGAAPKC